MATKISKFIYLSNSGSLCTELQKLSQNSGQSTILQLNFLISSLDSFTFRDEVWGCPFTVAKRLKLSFKALRFKLTDTLDATDFVVEACDRLEESASFSSLRISSRVKML